MGKKDLLISLILVILTVFLVTIFWKYNILLFFLLITLSFVSLVIWREKKDIVLYLVSFFVGPTLEIIVINFGGAWFYVNPSFLNVPFWLFPLWGLTGLILSKASYSLIK